MHFAYNDEQVMLRDSVDRYGQDTWQGADRKAIAEHAARRWHEMADLGWLALALPETHGGLGGGPVEIMAVMEGMGRHLMVSPYVATCVLAPALLADGGDAAGEVMAQIGSGAAMVGAGLIEADGGHDLHHVATRAEGSGRAWQLTGAKLHVEDGADAAWYVVSARTAGAVHDAGGIGLFLVPAGAHGLTVERFRAIDQHRHARLKLDGVTAAIPLGVVDNGLPTITAAVDRAICAHLAEATGSMEAAADATLEYLRTRKQFGVAIGSFQALQHRMVDMAIACEEARAMTYQATLSLHHGASERRRAVSGGKARVSQSGMFVGQQAVQLHGGVGFSDELIISHHLRRQMMLDLAHGPADHHVTLFAQTTSPGESHG
jgi:pimeloyl-CoA dehydrogenase